MILPANNGTVIAPASYAPRRDRRIHQGERESREWVVVALGRESDEEEIVIVVVLSPPLDNWFILL